MLQTKIFNKNVNKVPLLDVSSLYTLSDEHVEYVVEIGDEDLHLRFRRLFLRGQRKQEQRHYRNHWGDSQRQPDLSIDGCLTFGASNKLHPVFSCLPAIEKVWRWRKGDSPVLATSGWGRFVQWPWCKWNPQELLFLLWRPGDFRLHPLPNCKFRKVRKGLDRVGFRSVRNSTRTAFSFARVNIIEAREWFKTPSQAASIKNKNVVSLEYNNQLEV